MRIGGVGSFYSTYVYNANVLDANSMNKLSRISDDVLDQKVDYSGLVQEENQNPLEPGETNDFGGVLEKQMNEGYQRAAKIFPDGIQPMEKPEAVATEGGEQNISYQMQRAIQAYEMAMTA